MDAYRTPPVSDNVSGLPALRRESDLEAVAAKARDYARSARAEATRNAYASDLRDFGLWCSGAGLESLPAAPQSVALYLTERAETCKVSTLRRRLTAIGGAHRDRELEDPTKHPAVLAVIRGIANEKGSAAVKKTALTIDLLRDALVTIGNDLEGVRNRAILLLGFAGAFRRSELAALDVADLEISRKGIVVTLRRSKTDQLGEGRAIAIPMLPKAAICPVRATQAWLTAADIDAGPLFRRINGGSVAIERISPRLVARLVKRVARSAGIAGDFSGHSLRAGFVTSAARAKVADRDISRVSGHKSIKVLGGYVRRANVFEDAALLEIVRH
jgi:integrase